jgi:hypothetical protein
MEKGNVMDKNIYEKKGVLALPSRCFVFESCLVRLDALLVFNVWLTSQQVSTHEK